MAFDAEPQSMWQSIVVLVASATSFAAKVSEPFHGTHLSTALSRYLPRPPSRTKPQSDSTTE